MSVAPTSHPPPTILKKPRSSSASSRSATNHHHHHHHNPLPKKPNNPQGRIPLAHHHQRQRLLRCNWQPELGLQRIVISFTWRYDNKCEPISWAKLVSSMSKFCQKCRGGTSGTKASCQSSHNVFGYRISQCNKVCGRHRGAKALAMLERVEGREKRERR